MTKLELKRMVKQVIKEEKEKKEYHEQDFNESIDLSADVQGAIYNILRKQTLTKGVVEEEIKSLAKAHDINESDIKDYIYHLAFRYVQSKY